jgi:hypothetical protein
LHTRFHIHHSLLQLDKFLTAGEYNDEMSRPRMVGIMIPANEQGPKAAFDSMSVWQAGDDNEAMSVMASKGEKRTCVAPTSTCVDVTVHLSQAENMAGGYTATRQSLA